MSRLYRSIQVLATLGIVLALYLLWEQVTQLPSVCSINSTVNCDAIISGVVKNTLGIPTPLYGLVGYSAILLSATFLWRKTLLGFATFGLAFCAYIAYEELFIAHTICPICILCQAIMLTVFVLSLILNFRRQ
jgi:uncharacterized membrane protein